MRRFNHLPSQNREGKSRCLQRPQPKIDLAIYQPPKAKGYWVGRGQGQCSKWICWNLLESQSNALLRLPFCLGGDSIVYLAACDTKASLNIYDLYEVSACGYPGAVGQWWR